MDRSLPPPVGPALNGDAARLAKRRTRRVSAIGLMLADQVLIFIGFAIAYWMRYGATWPEPLNRIVVEVATRNQVDFVAFLPIILPHMLFLGLRFTTRGLYRGSPRINLLDQISAILSSTLIGIALLIVFVFLYKPFFYSRLIFFFAGATITFLLVAWRLLLWGYHHWRWSRGQAQDRVLVIGGTGLGQQVMNGIAASPGLGYALVGYLDDRPIVASDRTPRVYRHLGQIEELEQVVRAQNVQQVIIALPFWEHGRMPDLVQTCHDLGVGYQVAPDFYQLSFDRVDVLQLSGVPLLRPKEITLAGVNLVLKRVLDVSLVLASMIVVIPITLVIALAIKLDSPGPIIFGQRRVGKGGQHFTCYKFRTMVPDAEARKAELEALNEADGPLFKMRDDPRVTRVGRFLRRRSLDELPQLWNVLRGEMSLIGPRPALPDEVARYEHWQLRRLEVLPGCAGLSQALGRSDVSFDEQVRLDLYYAENWSVGMDLRILIMIIPAIIGGHGAY
ncbi:exopolysaccharide biosynthesis polyprenyl glycosylphosphotransferase [Oscillochloris trichoides DG-6]|uniref:Exopolysaccharide biosynthesis polyprenyl glycosylphosphotransferase n=1 Tax=Oscillochloris trichoides DG-6 TaxID=765420 RepID=E1IAX4_9CHLR|nr:sugar transferase [Oscillochloris trichoides]EFO81620.1 exopolysaccharide biosynthesis polyprenyl glycosylphosphotransferase [Oscillochloris trichoides DG-6]